MGVQKEENLMIKITNVRPKELNIFNRDFGNLKQYVVNDLLKETWQEFILTTVTHQLFESELEIAKKFNKSVLNLLDERYKQQLEDHLQISMSNCDIMTKSEYDDEKRKNIKCTRKGESIIDTIIEEFSSKKFIEYLCDEELQRQTGECFEIKKIKLPDVTAKLIYQVINENYLELKGKNKIIEANFIYKVLVIADMLTNGNETLIYILENEDVRCAEVIQNVLNKLETWRKQLFFYILRKKLELNKDEYIKMNNILKKYEPNWNEKQKEDFVDFLEDNFFTNISFGILFYNAKAITIYYKMPKEQQNIIKNFVVRLSEKIKKSLVEELKDFNIKELEEFWVSDDKKEIAAKIQLYLINYKWLEIFIRDNQIKKGVTAKEWNLYKNVSKTVLTRSELDCLEEREVAEKIRNVKENYSLNNLCERNFDKMAFWYLVILLREGEITKEHFIKEQQKKCVSMELINLFYALIEE